MSTSEAASRARLENSMVSETVIYMNPDGEREAAVILSVHSDRVVDLKLLSSGETITSIAYSNTDQRGHWWRRNKF
jgi:hypothetical protein